jgi:TRAP-type C4-dicarboxylate transport system substrate-binding protein
MTRPLAALLALALTLAALPAHAEAVRLTYSNFFPPTHIQSQLAEQWCAEVEKRTGGAVRVDYFPGGTLTKAPEIYDGVTEGLCDIGMSAPGYTRGRFPVLSAVDLPLGYASGPAATAVANAVFEKFRPAEFDAVEVMYFHAHGPGLLHTVKKPVATLEDLKGLKLRATGNSAKVVQALGATPVAMSMPDAYQAMQKGVVDGGLHPVETNKGWKMGEVVRFMTQSRAVAYTTAFYVVMNKARWAAIPPEAQAAIRELNVEWAARHGQAWDASDAEGMEFFLSKGGQVTALGDGEAERWRAACAPILDEYVREAEAAGLDGKAILEFIQATLRQAQGD